MLDDILNSDSLFLSKEQLNDIKNIKIETDVIKTVAKVACIILNEKPKRKCNAINYFSQSHWRNSDNVPG